VCEILDILDKFQLRKNPEQSMVLFSFALTYNNNNNNNNNNKNNIDLVLREPSFNISILSYRMGWLRLLST